MNRSTLEETILWRKNLQVHQQPILVRQIGALDLGPIPCLWKPSDSQYCILVEVVNWRAPKSKKLLGWCAYIYIWMDWFKYVFSKHKSLSPKFAIFSCTKEHISTIVVYVCSTKKCNTVIGYTSSSKSTHKNMLKK